MPLTNPWPLAGDTDYVIKTQAVITEIETALDAVGGMTEWTAADAAGPASLDFHEDTDNGTNKITLVAPAALGSDFTLVLPAASDTLVGKATSDTFTNKTFNANGTGNSLTNVEVADFAPGVVDTDLSSVSGSDDTLASAKAIKTALDLKAPLASPVLTGTPTIPSFASAGHNHTNAAGGGQLTDAALSAAVGIAKGGTGQTTAQNARNALLPTQSGNAGKVLISNGTDVSWAFQEQFGPHLYVATRWYDNLFLYGGDESGGMNFIPNNISAMPFFFSTPLTITGFRVRRTNTSGTDTVSIAIYDWGHFASSGQRVGSQGQISISTTTGWYSVTGLSIAIPSPGWYLIAFHSGNNGCSYETRQFVMTTPWGSASGSTDQDSLMQMDNGYSGGMPSTFTPTGYWRPSAVSFPVVQFQVSP